MTYSRFIYEDRLDVWKGLSVAEMTVCYAPVLISHIEFDKGYKGFDSLFNPALISNLTFNSE